MYERRLVSFSKTPECRSTTSMYQMAADKPFDEEVKHRTDLVTRRLKELIIAMQDRLTEDAFVPCAERIRVAVAELTAIFTQPVSVRFIRQYFLTYIHLVKLQRDNQGDFKTT